jgi:hypothetical protein
LGLKLLPHISARLGHCQGRHEKYKVEITSILCVNVVSRSITKYNCTLKYYQNITSTVPIREAWKCV